MERQHHDPTNDSLTLPRRSLTLAHLGSLQTRPHRRTPHPTPPGLGAVTQGTVKWWGEVTPVLERDDQKLAFVFQDPTLMPWATVAANVSLPFKLNAAHNTDLRSAVTRALVRVGLDDFTEAYPRQLSGGMRMRVSIARALVTEPPLLLMDEPFAALDEITRFKLNNELLTLWQEMRRTVIFVTHSVFESVFLSQRILVMTPRPGRVFADIEIPAAYPRDESFRTSAEFAGYCRRVSEALAQAMQVAP